MKIKTAFFSMFVFFVQLLSAQPSQIYINEFLASNKTVNQDPINSAYADWIEIANFSSDSVDLSGCYLTDDLSQPDKWVIPANTVIPGDDFLIIWADDMDTLLHTNFKLSKDGEMIGLYTSTGVVIDTLTFPVQDDDISYGRISDNIMEWSYFTPPSPLARNQSSSEIDIADAPQFSISGGFYNGQQTLILTGFDTSVVIRYTINGTPPDTTSQLYGSPIILDSTTAVRARAFQSGKIPSRIVTNTFLINETNNLPVVSLVTDPDNFFDNMIGIYITGTNGIAGDCDATIRNLNQDWERPVNIEFYETTGEMRMNQGAGVKIFGGCSRTRYPQKSLALYARSEYGKGSFDYQLFPSKQIMSFESFLLRSSGDDQVYTMFRDGLAHITLWLGMDADIQAYRPAVVFLNGVYWGIHNIREKVNEHYTEGNYHIDPGNVNILERNPYDSWNVKNGSAETYNAMMDYIQTNDMMSSVNYEYVKTQMDMDEYIDYQIGHIYLAEKDWPGNNIRFWKANTGKYTRWRWVNYDMDQTFIHITTDNLAAASEVNGPSWPNPPWSTLLFRKLLENESFKNEFIQRYAYYMSTIFKPENLIHIVDSLKDRIAPEIPRHIVRWGGQLDPDFNEGWDIKPTFSSVEMWEQNVDTVKLFCEQRPQYAVQHILNKFGISGTALLTLAENIPSAGKIEINGYTLPDSGYSAAYFKTIPITVEALPVSGYRFSHWTMGTTTVPLQKIIVTLSSDTALTANYEPAVLHDSTIVIINEINYNSSSTFDPGDWVELYNRQSQAVDLSDWYLRDEDDNNSFTFPQGTSINAHGYLVVSNALADFQNLFTSIDTVIGSFDFGFKSGGEVIRLYSNNQVLIDSVHYDDADPWPAAPNGNGPTLELKNPLLDNDIGSNWNASSLYGTPGAANSYMTAVDDQPGPPLPKKYELFHNYPNPFNPSTAISYQLVDNSYVTLKIYDLLGREVAVLVDEVKEAGYHTAIFDGSRLSSGIYFMRIFAKPEKGKPFIQVRKMLMLK